MPGIHSDCNNGFRKLLHSSFLTVTIHHMGTTAGPGILILLLDDVLQEDIIPMRNRELLLLKSGGG